MTPVLSAEEALRTPQVHARALIDETDGKPAVALPLRFDGKRGVNTAAAPALGADNAAILSR